MGKIYDKVMNIMKMEGYQDDNTEEEKPYEDDYSTFTGEPTPVEKPISRNFKSYNGGKSKVMNLQASVQMEVVVLQPSSFEESQEICDNIKNKKPCIINFDSVDSRIAQRIMDFVSGSCYTLDGRLQKIADKIFLIAPQNVDILGDFKEELKSNGFIDWRN